MAKSILLPLINVRDVVIYPGMELSLRVGREFTIKAIQYAKTETRGKLIVVTQKAVETEHQPSRNEVFTLGTVCRIRKSLSLTDGTMKVLMQGLGTIKLNRSIDQEGFQIASGALIAKKRSNAKWQSRQERNRVLDLLVKWNPRMTYGDDTSKFDQLKRQENFEMFLDLALSLIASPISAWSEGFLKKPLKEQGRLINHLILKRQRLLQLGDRRKQLKALMEILAEEIVNQL